MFLENEIGVRSKRSIPSYYTTDSQAEILVLGRIPVEAIKTVMYVGIGIYVVYAMILYILGQKFLNKGVNIE